MAYTVTNPTPGARGLSDLTIESGATVEGLDLTDEQKALLESVGCTVEGPKRGRPPKVEEAPVAVTETVETITE